MTSYGKQQCPLGTCGFGWGHPDTEGRELQEEAERECDDELAFVLNAIHNVEAVCESRAIANKDVVFGELVTFFQALAMYLKRKETDPPSERVIETLKMIDNVASQDWEDAKKAAKKYAERSQKKK